MKEIALGGISEPLVMDKILTSIWKLTNGPKNYKATQNLINEI